MTYSVDKNHKFRAWQNGSRNNFRQNMTLFENFLLINDRSKEKCFTSNFKNTSMLNVALC